MKLINTAQIEIKKSKFISYYYELDDIKEVKIILEELKQEHKKAKHIVYAYKFLNTAGKSDDKEPSGTAGMPLYNILERNNLNNKMLVVVRYFGGTKLGAGPLTRAYNNAGAFAIKKWSFDHFFYVIHITETNFFSFFFAINKQN